MQSPAGRTNTLQFIHGDPPAVRTFCAAKTNTQLSVPPLLLDYLRQLRIKLAVTALFLHRHPALSGEQNSPTLTVSLLSFAFPSAFSSLLHSASPTSCPQPPSLQQLLKPAGGLTAEFRLARESPDIHTIQGGNILTCGGQCRQLVKRPHQNHCFFRSAPYHIHHRDRRHHHHRPSPSRNVWDLHQYVAYSCRQLPSSENKTRTDVRPAYRPDY